MSPPIFAIDPQTNQIPTATLARRVTRMRVMWKACLAIQSVSSLAKIGNEHSDAEIDN